MGIYDNNYYYIHGRIASELYREVRPTFQRNSFYAVLMAAGILVPRPEGMYCDRERRANVIGPRFTASNARFCVWPGRTALCSLP